MDWQPQPGQHLPAGRQPEQHYNQHGSEHGTWQPLRYFSTRDGQNSLPTRRSLHTTWQEHARSPVVHSGKTHRGPTSFPLSRKICSIDACCECRDACPRPADHRRTAGNDRRAERSSEPVRGRRERLPGSRTGQDGVSAADRLQEGAAVRSAASNGTSAAGALHLRPAHPLEACLLQVQKGRTRRKKRLQLLPGRQELLLPRHRGEAGSGVGGRAGGPGIFQP